MQSAPPADAGRDGIALRAASSAEAPAAVADALRDAAARRLVGRARALEKFSLGAAAERLRNIADG